MRAAVLVIRAALWAVAAAGVMQSPSPLRLALSAVHPISIAIVMSTPHPSSSQRRYYGKKSRLDATREINLGPFTPLNSVRSQHSGVVLAQIAEASHSTPHEHNLNREFSKCKSFFSEPSGKTRKIIIWVEGHADVHECVKKPNEKRPRGRKLLVSIANPVDRFVGGAAK
ncbi:hypothetical protein Tcan_09647 [Toxocara canis]|uniref:Uncharacterized protein n=1 Tax=Toxocara canis TaxID=6265 RepID=A0A0B2UTS6_TOXCA|nr:hypothetical protein Tcan_09647 [Toxocara canis]